MLTEAELLREAADSGFRAEILEKVFRLTELLETLWSHPFLKTQLALKGGTALSLFVFDLPRLSVDVDLNYVGLADVEGMHRERPGVEQAIQAVCGRLGITVRRTPSEHAGGKWRLSYAGVRGTGILELNVSFLLRTPLWPVVYGGSSRLDWRTLSLETIGTTPEEVDRQLVPMLRGDLAPGRANLKRWTGQLVAECQDLLSSVLPLEENEIEFLTRLNDGGEIAPELNTEAPEERRIIASRPGLLWKALNVRKHTGQEP